MAPDQEEDYDDGSGLNRRRPSANGRGHGDQEKTEGSIAICNSILGRGEKMQDSTQGTRHISIFIQSCTSSEQMRAENKPTLWRALFPLKRGYCYGGYNCFIKLREKKQKKRTKKANVP